MALDDDRSGELFLYALWRELADLSAAPWPEPMTTAGLSTLRASEWSERFETLMRARLIMGALRYGRLRAPGKPKYDRVSSMIKRLEEYRRTRNAELLVDTANLALLEFEEGENVLTPMDEREHVARRA
jgi:hypothetical protein